MKAARLRMLASAAAIALALAVAGCSQPGPSASAPDPRLGGTWHLVTAHDADGTLMVGGRDVTLKIGSFTGGASPCNGYSASIVGGVGVIYIRTQQQLNGQACPNQVALDLDARYLRALDASRFLTIANGMLRLTSPHTLLVYSKTALPEPDVDTAVWYLAQLPEKTTSHAAGGAYNPPVSLTFSGYNALHLESSCTGLDADYTVHNAAIALGTIRIQLKISRLCTSHGKLVDDRVEWLLFSPFTANISYAAGERGTTVVITNRASRQSALFVPEAPQT